nr:MAG: hypothetical protein [Molluscum contagiosum virus]
MRSTGMRTSGFLACCFFLGAALRVTISSTISQRRWHRYAFSALALMLFRTSWSPSIAIYFLLASFKYKKSRIAASSAASSAKSSRRCARGTRRAARGESVSTACTTSRNSSKSSSGVVMNTPKMPAYSFSIY